MMHAVERGRRCLISIFEDMACFFTFSFAGSQIPQLLYSCTSNFAPAAAMSSPDFSPNSLTWAEERCESRAVRSDQCSNTASSSQAPSAELVWREEKKVVFDAETCNTAVPFEL